MQYQNPFKPTAGKMPPVLVGREKVTDDFLEGLANGEGAPGRLMRITGPRGSGKTVLLSELASIAEDEGWLVVNVSGSGDLLASLSRRLMRKPFSSEIVLKAQPPLVSIEARRGSANLDDFESILECATRGMTRRGKGLLVTIDEVQDASRDDIREIATAVQFMIRENQNIALVFAGITTGVLDILNGKSVTFLRRAKPEELDAIPLDEVRDSLRDTIADSGFQIEEEALALATDATQGYAYLIQLVGYHVWRTAWLRGRRDDDAIVVSVDDAARGVAAARDEFKSAVLETAITGLPKTAIDFILAMSETRDVVSTSKIASMLKRTTGYLSPYRRQLISRQVIEQTAPGYVTFSIPLMKEYLAEERASILSRYGE